MAMTIKFRLHPYGYSATPIEFADIAMHTTEGGQYHYYDMHWKGKNGTHRKYGYLPKYKSGHRNVLHFLRDMIEDIGIDDLPENYISVPLNDGTDRVFDDERRVLRQQGPTSAERTNGSVRQRKDNTDPKGTTKRSTSKKVASGAKAKRSSKRKDSA